MSEQIQQSRDRLVPEGEARIEDYLDHVCAPLIGRVAYAERMGLRAELRAHLDAMVAAAREVSADEADAVEAALSRFGPPQALARQWLRARRPLAAAASARPATLIALGWFGWATTMTYVLGYLSLDSAGQISDFLGAFAAIGAALLAGLITGLLSPARHALGAFYAMAMLLGPTALVVHFGFAMGGDLLFIELVELTCMQALLWLPLGCGAAALGGWLRGLRDAAIRPWRLPA